MKFIKIIFSVTLALFISDSFAQTSSSYTRFGVGDIEYSYSSRKLGMGQLGVSVADLDHISGINPASWYRLSSTRIEFSLVLNGIFISDKTQTKYYTDTDFKGFTFGFPVSQRYGISAAIGIIPVTRISYNVVDKVVSTDPLVEDHEINYEGKGGLSKIFVGTSYKLPFDVVLGAALDYYFGNLNYFSRVDFQIGDISTEFEKSYRPTGFGTTVGIISPNLSQLFSSDEISDFRLGAAVSLVSNLSTDTILTSFSGFTIDTVNIGTTELKIPTRLTTGLSFVLSNEYLFSLDYSYQPWEYFRLSDSKSAVLRNASKVSLGFEFRPDKKLGDTFWEQILLRAGLSFEQTPYIINNEGINQYSVSGGFSLPLSASNTMDVNIQYSIRGTTDANLLKEQTIKLNLGISLGEIWFIRHEK